MVGDEPWNQAYKHIFKVALDGVLWQDITERERNSNQGNNKVRLMVGVCNLVEKSGQKLRVTTYNTNKSPLDQ